MREFIPAPPQQPRRDFLGALVASAAALASGLAASYTVATTAQAKPAEQPVSSQQRWGMLIDTTKCATDCDACVRACETENGLARPEHPATDAQWIRKVQLRDKLTGHVTALPMLCQHCEHPPCVDVCPTGASFRRADGIVLVDRHICIGCRYCMMACPYKARSFIHEKLTEQLPHMPRGKGCVESCTFCMHRVDAGQSTTACAEACDRAGHKAILFGDLNDPNSALAQRARQVPSRQIRADLQLNTGVRYEGI